MTPAGCHLLQLTTAKHLRYPNRSGGEREKEKRTLYVASRWHTTGMETSPQLPLRFDPPEPTTPNRNKVLPVERKPPEQQRKAEHPDVRQKSA